jgi:tetratricopeptide (TPR) repeat protein
MRRDSFRRFRAALRRGAARSAAGLRRLLAAGLRAVFPILCLALALLLLVEIGILVTSPKPDAKVLAILIPALLAAAFLGAYGHDVATRIRKLGPVEIGEIQDDHFRAWEMPRRLAVEETGSVIFETSGRPAVPSFSPEKDWAFEQGDRYLSFLEFSGRAEPPDGPQRQQLLEALLFVGRAANARGQWGKAIQRLAWLERLAGGSAEPSAIADLAMANLYSGLRAEGRHRDAYFAEAMRRLAGLARSGELEGVGYFWLAYAQDELERFYEAVASNREALARRPRLATAKYNAALALLNLEDPEGAYAMLKGIRPSDEEGVPTLQSARDDPDFTDRLRPFEEDRWGRRIAAWRRAL